MVQLVLAEKPSVGRDIARVLGCTKSAKGYMMGNGYVVTWAIGHLVTLCMPNEYNKAWRKWSFDVLPMIPEEIKIKPVEDTLEQFNIVKTLMNDASIDSIVCATDSGREGENIFRLIYIMAECTKPFKRLWISSLTDESIIEGFNNLKDGSSYDNLFQAALSRAFADWLVGLNATKAFSAKYKGAKLSIGRVQTPTLALVVQKQKEIDAFKSKDYWIIKAYYDSFTGQWFHCETNESRVYSEQDAKSIVEKVKNKRGMVIDIQNNNIKEPPPFLYNLTDLQKDANRKYGFTAQETLDIAQSLYERKHITYPRTDSNHLSEDILPSIPERLLRISQDLTYKGLAKYILELPELPVSKRFIDNTKLTDHHAIIPDLVIPKSLGEDDAKVYDLIVKRFLAVFYPNYDYNIKTIIVEVENEKFSSSGRTVNALGWTEVYKGSPEDEDSGPRRRGGKENPAGHSASLHCSPCSQDNEFLPDIQVGDCIDVLNAKATKNSTRPPSQYTDETILSAMEHAGRFVDDKSVKEQLKSCGLGTSATRAAIIEKLIANAYIQRRQGYLKPTQKGMELIEIVDSELKSPEMTGKWEQALHMIEEGKMSSKVFISCISDFVKELIYRVQMEEKRTDLQIASLEEGTYKNYKKGG